MVTLRRGKPRLYPTMRFLPKTDDGEPTTHCRLAND
jgi:hypothetical protein